MIQFIGSAPNGFLQWLSQYFSKNLNVFLLDRYPANLHYAFALRALSEEYAVRQFARVRRDVDGATFDVTQSSFDDGTLESFMTLNGTNTSITGTVVQLNDQSNNLRTATQADPAKQPTIWKPISGLVTNFGEPAIEFDGIDDELTVTNSGVLSDFTLFSMIKFNNLATGIGALVGVDQAGVVYDGAQNGIGYSDAVTAFQLLLDKANIDGNTALYSVMTDKLGVRLSPTLDGTTYGSLSPAGGDLEVDFSSINGRFTSNITSVVMQDLIVYSAEKTAERADILDYINYYYQKYLVPNVAVGTGTDYNELIWNATT